MRQSFGAKGGEALSCADGSQVKTLPSCAVAEPESSTATDNRYEAEFANSATASEINVFLCTRTEQCVKIKIAARIVSRRVGGFDQQRQPD